MKFKQKSKPLDGTYVPGFDGGFYSNTGTNQASSPQAVSAGTNRTFFWVFTFVLTLLHLFPLFATSHIEFSLYYVMCVRFFLPLFFLPLFFFIYCSSFSVLWFVLSFSFPLFFYFCAGWYVCFRIRSQLLF